MLLKRDDADAVEAEASPANLVASTGNEVERTQWQDKEKYEVQ
jgi:hypothetical protein